MKNRLLSVASTIAVMSAFAGNVDAASFSTVDWQMSNWFKPISTSTNRASAYKAPEVEPVEMVSGFGAQPSSATSTKADYDRLWNYYNSDEFVKSYQEAYRAALLKRGFDPSHADKLTPREIKTSTAAAFANPNAANGLQPVGYYVGQTQIQPQVQPQVQTQTQVQASIQQPQLLQQQFATQQAGYLQQQGFVQQPYVQANVAQLQYQNQVQAQATSPTNFVDQAATQQFMQQQALASIEQQNLQITETTTTSVSGGNSEVEASAIVAAPVVTTSTETFSFASRSVYQPRGYMSAKFGVNKLLDTKFTASNSDSITVKNKLGFGGSIAAGMYLNEMSNVIPSGLRMGAEVGLFAAKVDKVETSLAGTPPTPADNRTLLAGFLNLAYDAETGSNLTPYFGVGLGAAKLTAEDYAYGNLSVKASEDVVLAGQVFAGMKYKMTNNMSLDIGGRYVNALKAVVASNGTDTEESSASVIEGNVGITLNF